MHCAAHWQHPSLLTSGGGCFRHVAREVRGGRFPVVPSQGLRRGVRSVVITFFPAMHSSSTSSRSGVAPGEQPVLHQTVRTTAPSDVVKIRRQRVGRIARGGVVGANDGCQVTKLRHAVLASDTAIQAKEAVALTLGFVGTKVAGSIRHGKHLGTVHTYTHKVVERVKMEKELLN
jgi:hypothetical protein